MKKYYYFAYGSNLSMQRMVDRNVTILSYESATLYDYELKFNKVHTS